jgi:hypothetical protein
MKWFAFRPYLLIVWAMAAIIGSFMAFWFGWMPVFAVLRLPVKLPQLSGI